MDRGDADPLLLRGEDNGADLHLDGGGIGRIPIDGYGAAQVDRDFLEFAALLVPQDQRSPGKFRFGEVGPERTGVHFQQPGGNDPFALAEDEGQAAHMAIGFRCDFPGGNAGGAAQAFLRGEKTFRGTDPPQRAVMRKSKEFQFFPAGLLPESNGGEDGEIKGSEGAAQLVILDRFEGIRGIEWKQQADRGGSIRGDGTEHEREVEPGPRPRFSGQILDRDESRKRWNYGRGRHGG